MVKKEEGEKAIRKKGMKKALRKLRKKKIN